MVVPPVATPLTEICWIELTTLLLKSMTSNTSVLSPAVVPLGANVMSILQLVAGDKPAPPSGHALERGAGS